MGGIVTSLLKLFLQHGIEPNHKRRSGRIMPVYNRQAASLYLRISTSPHALGLHKFDIFQSRHKYDRRAFHRFPLLQNILSPDRHCISQFPHILGIASSVSEDSRQRTLSGIHCLAQFQNHRQRHKRQALLHSIR